MNGLTICISNVTNGCLICLLFTFCVAARVGGCDNPGRELSHHATGPAPVPTHFHCRPITRSHEAHRLRGITQYQAYRIQHYPISIRI